MAVLFPKAAQSSDNRIVVKRSERQFLQSPHLTHSHTQAVDPTKTTIMAQTRDECPCTPRLNVLIKKVYQARSHPTARMGMQSVCQGMGLAQGHKPCWAELSPNSPFPFFLRALVLGCPGDSSSHLISTA